MKTLGAFLRTLTLVVAVVLVPCVVMHAAPITSLVFVLVAALGVVS